MSRAKHGETRRNDGFRVADARQVRVEALEKTVQILKRERDTARMDAERAQREVRALVAANDGLAKQRHQEAESAQSWRAAAMDLQMKLNDARAQNVGWWDRLFGRVA
jgi:uncharacterized protein YukE